MRNESNSPAFGDSRGTVRCNAGFVAPDACLPATDGNFRTPSELRGPNGLLLILLVEGCPYTEVLLPRIARDIVELHRYGIGSVALNPGRTFLRPAESLATMARFARLCGLPCPYLLDTEQTLTRALGATHTPDFFGFDRRLELRYHGRLDASRREPAPADARRDLFAAMRQIALFGSAPRHQLTGIGSPIEWRVQTPFCKDSTAPN